MNIRKKGTLLSMIVLLLLATATLTTSAATTVTIQSAEVNISGSTTVPIMINNVTGVKGAHILLEYNNTVVQALDIGNSSFYMELHKEINNTVGYVRYAVLSLTGLSGNVKFADVTLKGMSVGESPLNLTVVSLNNGTAEIPRDVINGTFTVTAVPPRIVTYTISNRTIVPPQTTSIDVEFSETVKAWIKIEDSAKNLVKQLYYSPSVKNPDPQTWDGTNTTGVRVPDGNYYVNVTGLNTTTGLSVINKTEIITVTSVLPPDTAPPIVVNPSADPMIIPEDTDNEPLWGELSELMVNATDESGIDYITVTVNNLSLVDKEVKVMNNIGNFTDAEGIQWAIFNCTTNASIGTAGWNGSAYVPYQLKVNATDIYGNSNESVSIELMVMKNGDVDENGAVNLDDGIYLVNYALHVPGYDLIPEIADVDGNEGPPNLDDGIYLVNHALLVPGYEILH